MPGNAGLARLVARRWRRLFAFIILVSGAEIGLLLCGSLTLFRGPTSLAYDGVFAFGQDRWTEHTVKVGYYEGGEAEKFDQRLEAVAESATNL